MMAPASIRLAGLPNSFAATTIAGVYSTVDDRNCFDLDQPLRTNQPADNHECARGWILSVDVLIADFPDQRDLRWVDAIDTVKIELDDVVKIASGSFDGSL